MKWIHALREKFSSSPAAPEKPAKQSKQTGPDTPAKPARGANIVATKPAEDLDRLRLMLAACSDNAERAPLAARLGLALAQGGQAPNADDLPEVWVAAICHAQDKAMAQTWLAGLDAETGLAEVAMRARGAEVRYAAARRIEDDALLEQVAQASRDKDKRVHRHCVDLLRQRRQAEASARRADEIAAELQGLLEKAPLPLSRLLALKQDLAALTAAGEAGQRCEALLNGAFARVHEESEALRDLHTRQSAAAALAAECARAEWPWREQADDWRIRAEALARFRDELPAWLAEEAATRALNATLSEIETCRMARDTDLERYDACDAFLTALEGAGEASPASEIAAAWAALARPGNPDALALLVARWQAAHGKLAPPPVPDAAPAPTDAVEPTHAATSEPTREPTKKPARGKTRVDQHAVVLLLDKLEQSIEQGHLADADATAKQIKNLLGDSSLRGNPEARLHQLQAQLETLRGWAKWGTGQAREQLIASANALLAGDRDTGALALAITALREAWKRLNVHGAATKEQWESFDAILEQAYQPVAAHREEVAARQAEARAAKEVLCEVWESEFAGLDWEHADFKVVEARRAELLQQWRAAPQAGFRNERQLRKRFDPLIAGIDQRLDAARAAEIERREQLVAAAEALAEQADLGRAMSEAKALQTRWNQQPAPVRLKRGVDEKLWQRFRAACNAVFARRDAQRAEQSSQQQARIQARQAHLDAFAAVLKSGDADAVKKAMATFRAEWAPGRTDANDAGDSQEIQARALQQQAQQILAAQSEAKYRAHYELLALKASLAGRVEAAALARQPLDTILGEARQAWDGLQSLPGKEENLLARRFAAAGDLTPATAEANRAALATLLLDLEIALGLPSPQPYAQARRERQLARLQNRFGATASQSDDASALLVQAYAMSVPPDTDFEQRIAAAVQNLTRQGSSA